MEASVSAGPRMICLSDPFGIVDSPTPARTQQGSMQSFSLDGKQAAADAHHVRSSSSSNDGWAALPTDVLGLVARELGLHEAQAMTRVCRGWLQGVDRTLTQLKPRSLHAVQMANRSGTAPSPLSSKTSVLLTCTQKQCNVLIEPLTEGFASRMIS